MKKLIIASLFAVSSSAFANTNFTTTTPTTMPSDSNWAVAMTARACSHVSLKSLKGATGEIIDIKGGVLYSVTLNGVVVAEATAPNTGLWAKKTCL